MIDLCNEDCLERIDKLPMGGVNSVITDPPYGISFQSSWMTERKRKPKILNDESPFVDWIRPLYSKMSNGGRLMCFYRWDVQEEFFEEIQSAGFTVKSQIVWDKVVHGMGDLKGEFAPQHELIVYATKGRYEFKGNRPKTLYRVQRVSPEKMIHPNEKPISLIKALIRDITVPGELLYEPFGGSFVTPTAAQLLGRKCIASEKHPDYYLLGLERYKKETQQQILF